MFCKYTKIFYSKSPLPSVSLRNKGLNLKKSPIETELLYSPYISFYTMLIVRFCANIRFILLRYNKIKYLYFIKILNKSIF